MPCGVMVHAHNNAFASNQTYTVRAAEVPRRGESPKCSFRTGESHEVLPRRVTRRNPIILAEAG